jgi:hypothetical protein
MLYILGGAPRTGKSILGRKFVSDKQIPFFCIDFLITAIEEGTPQIGIKHGQPFISKAEGLWPLVKPLLTHLIREEPNYLIEGDGILPKQVSELQKLYPHKIQSCFVGFAGITASEKLKQIREFGGNQDDWTKKVSDEKLFKTIEDMIEYSKYLKEECDKYDISYFDLSNNFSESLEKVFQYLIK